MKESKDLCRSVVDSFPELQDIQNEALREKVIEAWVYSLGKSSFRSIEEIRPSGNPDTASLKRGTQTDHIRGVTQLAMALGASLAAQFPELSIDRDLLIACGLCHDVGKPYEFDPLNQERWRSDPGAAGFGE